jgi:hypothetical protein
VKSFIFVLLLATWASAQAPVTFNYKNVLFAIVPRR